MRCLAVCQDELVIRMLDEILAASIEVEFLVESRALARKLKARPARDSRRRQRTDTYMKADISPKPASSSKTPAGTYLHKVIESVRDAGGALIYVLGVGIANDDREKRAQDVRDHFFRCLVLVAFRALRSTAPYRVQPCPHTGARPAIPALPG
jgi:hypothetical protein